MDSRWFISDKMIIDELDRLAGTLPGESTGSVERAFDLERDRERQQVRWQSGEAGIAFEITDADRALSLDKFSFRICVPAIHAWRGRIVQKAY